MAYCRPKHSHSDERGVFHVCVHREWDFRVEDAARYDVNSIMLCMLCTFVVRLSSCIDQFLTLSMCSWGI